MKFLALLSLLFCFGCSNEIIKPPLFAKGDIVNVRSSDELGIVESLTLSSGEWRYYVLFPLTDLNYLEKDLQLYKRAIWHKDSEDNKIKEKKGEVKAEVSYIHSGSNFGCPQCDITPPMTYKNSLHLNKK